jgi:hypothetical protein
MTRLTTTAALAAILATGGTAEAQTCTAPAMPPPGCYGQPGAMVPVKAGLFGLRTRWVPAPQVQGPMLVAYAVPQQRPVASGQAVATAEVSTAPSANAAFLGWLNQTRAAYQLPPVEYSAAVEADCHVNNQHQVARGMNHWHMGCHRRQNAAFNLGFPGVEAAWMGSPGHSSALLDPTIRFVGIAWLNGYCTYGAR